MSIRDELIAIVDECCPGPDTEPSKAVDRILGRLIDANRSQSVSGVEWRSLLVDIKHGKF